MALQFANSVDVVDALDKTHPMGLSPGPPCPQGPPCPLSWAFLLIQALRRGVQSYPSDKRRISRPGLGAIRRSAVALLAGLLLLLGGGPAQAQKLLAVATAMSATREAARVYIVCLDLDLTSAIQAVYALPGAAPTGPLYLRENGQGAVLTTEAPGKLAGLPESGVQSYLSELEFQPSAIRLHSSMAAPPGWRGWAGCLLPEVMGQPSTALLREALANEAMDGSVMEAVPYFLDGASSAPGKIRWRLPGKPVAACAPPVPTGAIPRLAVLCHSETEGVSLLVPGEVSPEAPRPQELHLSSNSESIHGIPAGLALDAAHRRLFVLTAGFDWEGSSGDAVSWLHMLDSDTLASAAPPLILRGSALNTGSSLCLTGDGRCWVAAELPEPGLIQFSGIQIRSGESGMQLETTAQYVLQGNGPVRWAPDPSSGGLAVGLDRVLEIWPEGDRKDIRHTFSNSIGALLWTGADLFAGEASQLHRIDRAQGKPIQTLQLQQGFIASLAAPPATTSFPKTPPSTASNHQASVEWPGPLIFHAEAAGQEIRGWPLPEGADPDAFQTDFDPAEMPWFQIIREQRAGRRNAFYFFVNAAYCQQGNPLQGYFHLTWNRTPGMPPLSAEVPVRVLSSADPVRRVLWLWSGSPGASFRSASDPASYRSLATLLAGPPFFFAHQGCAGPFQDSLAPYTVVVVEAEAAAHGWITRRAALDYVSSGGALLFLGKNLGAAEDESLRAWLAPLQIRLDMRTNISGTFSPHTVSPLTEYWGQFQMENGGLFQAPPETILVPRGTDPKEGVFAATGYGYGRMALLSAATPLQSPQLSDDTHREFAIRLFSWLARARSEYADLDSDRLPDAIEDRNNSGRVDPGETDYLRADSDGDGLPDGIEDANLNGVVDDAETDPRNPDSDGDGWFDGADPIPCPSHGQLYLAAAVPPQAPAEGGRSITLLGRNFTPSTRFWFGGQPARLIQWLDPSSAILRLPQSISEVGRAVDIRAQASANGAEAVLPQGFLYLPRSRAALRLIPAETPLVTQGLCKGRLGVEVTLPPDVLARQISLLIEAAPASGFAWGTPETAEQPPPFHVQGRALKGARYLVIVESSGAGLPTGRLFNLSYSFPAGKTSETPCVVNGLRATAITTENSALDANFSIGTITLSPTETKAP